MFKAKKMEVCAVCLLVVFLLFVGGCTVEMPEIVPKAPVAEGEIRIMSFNIRCAEFTRARKIAVPQLVLEYLPDSVGMQECTYNWFKQLTSTLDNYAFIGVGRDTGDRSSRCGEMSPILYRTDKYNLIDSGTFWLSETPEEVSYGWDAACRRICTWVILENIQTGEQYVHINTHMDHKGEEARQNATAMITEFADTFDLPTVITGDFNFDKGCDKYNHILEAGYFDTAELTENTDTGRTYHAYDGGLEGLPIDFIFTDSEETAVSAFKIIRDQYDEAYPSDHYPVYADLIFG